MSNTSFLSRYSSELEVDTRDLQQALRRVASTVHVIAVRASDGSFFATTATAVISICFEPPTMAVCINRNSVIHEVLACSEIFTISVLRADQKDVSGACSGGMPHEERERFFSTHDADPRAPVVIDAQASMICRRSSVIDQGTHAVVFGIVVAAAFQEQINPLIYAGGKYGVFSLL